MAFSFLYLAIRAVLGALVRSRRGLDAKDIELLGPRQVHGGGGQKCPVSHPELRPCYLSAQDRELMPQHQRSLLLVSPRTLLRWHQALVRRKWRVGCGNSVRRRVGIRG
jgi:putative transposase